MNNRKKGVVKYLVWWKGFIVKYDSWEREEDLENTKKAVVEFERGLNIEVRRQENLEEKKFKRGELLGRYTVKMLYSWDNRQFKEEYLRKLERN